MSNIFKSILLILILLFIGGCSEETPEQLRKRADVLEQKDASKKRTITSDNGDTFQIIKINHHEYLRMYTPYRYGICHYEDCEYCLKNKKDK